MGWLRRLAPEQQPAQGTASLPAFTQCPGCSFDFITGEGNRSCNWYECPYLPDAYNVVCPDCNYNFATREGRSACGTPPTCRWAEPGYAHARAARKHFGAAS